MVIYLYECHNGDACMELKQGPYTMTLSDLNSASDEAILMEAIINTCQREKIDSDIEYDLYVLTPLPKEHQVADMTKGEADTLNRLYS